MYLIYTAVLRAVLPYSRKKITIFRDALEPDQAGKVILIDSHGALKRVSLNGANSNARCVGYKAGCVDLTRSGDK
jgi:hypothetical protein